jgi:hypothetical protein
MYGLLIVVIPFKGIFKKFQFEILDKKINSKIQY